MENSSDIRDILERIHELQLQLIELNGRLRRGALLLKSQAAAIQKNETALKTVSDEYNKLHAYAKQKELEVAQNDLNLAKRKEQLREAKTNKEYQALQMQISADEAARSVLDDEALEAIEKAENFHANVESANNELKKSQELFEKTKKKYSDDKPKIDADIVNMEKTLQAEETKLPREFKEIYDRLKRNFAGGESLSVVENQRFCGSCNHQIPINSLAMILQKIPITCSSCSRLLYIPNDFVFERG
jgi:predicted  nucleic acid-binding Zn-ribbon protein